MGIRSSIKGALGFHDGGGAFAPGGAFSDPGGDMTANQELLEQAKQEAEERERERERE